MPVLCQCCLAVLLGVVIGPSVPGPAWPWAVLVVGLAMGSWVRGGSARVAGLCAGVLLVLSLPPGPVLEGYQSVRGVRVGAPAGGSADVALTHHRVVGGPWRPTAGRLRLRFRDRPPPAGASIIAFGHAHGPRRALPGAPDPIRAAALARVYTVMAVRRWARVGGDVAVRHTPHDPTGVLGAVALGDRTAVSAETRLTLRRTGTSHLLAISGFHVGIVALAAAGAVAVGLRLAAVVRPRGLGTRGTLTIGVLAALTYTVVAGAPISAQRAVGLLALGAAGRLLGRGVQPLPLLGVVAVALAARDPSALATPSMQLSFGAVAGLMLVLPRVSHVRPPSGVRRWLFDGTAATVAATLGTLPAAAWWFQEVSPSSPVANLVAVPAMGLVIAPCAAAASLAPEPLAAVAGWVGTGVTRLLLWALGALEMEPLTPAVGPLGAVGLAVGLVTALRWQRVGGVLCLLSLALRPMPTRPTLTVLDVGQGDAMLLESPGGRRELVDAGPRGTAVVQWLRRRGVRRLDRVVVTHDEVDHAGGVGAVVAGLRVGSLWFPQGPGVAPPGLLHPLPGDSVAVGNAGSAVLDRGCFLLTGDLDADGEQRIMGRLSGPVPVLKVPHHGSDSSSSEGGSIGWRPNWRWSRWGGATGMGIPATR